LAIVLFVLLFWPLCCLFFDIRILITLLVSSNSSYSMLTWSWQKESKGELIFFSDKVILSRLFVSINQFPDLLTIDKYYIYHGSYELTYLNQRIRRMSWFK
jgi:hypothetical protein